MIKIIFFADSYKFFKDWVEEYQKRLWKNIEILKCRPSKGDKNTIIKKETTELRKILQKEKWYKALLFINWKEFSSESFYEFIDKKTANFWNIIFIIWWAYWVDYDIISDLINEKISLSKMTFPHSMAILILLEQIYRAFEIKKWSSYHH